MEAQLRGALVAVQVAGALLIGVGIGFVLRGLFGDDSSQRVRDIVVAIGFMLLPGPILFHTAREARRRLAEERPSGRTYGILAGLFMLLASLPFVLAITGVLGIALGLFTLTAAWLAPRRGRAVR